RFDQAYTFQYSPRPGTKAAGFAEQVPKDVVQNRFDRLIALQEGISLERNAAMVGDTVEALVEGTGRKGRIQGRTRTNKVVRFDAEIVSVDSMSVYLGMDVGTAKPTAAERSRVPHHLLDVAEVDEEFSVAAYQALARDAVAGIEARGRTAMLVGGTGLYFRA